MGIKCAHDLGPRFSEKSGGNALDIDPKNIPRGFMGNVNLGFGFMCPDGGDNRSIFTGNAEFDVTELEIFKIDF